MLHHHFADKSNNVTVNLGCLRWETMKTGHIQHIGLITHWATFCLSKSVCWSGVESDCVFSFAFCCSDACWDLRVTNYPSKICGVKGSIVSLHCSVDSKGQEVIWVVGSEAVDLRADWKYSGRVTYSYQDYNSQNRRRSSVVISDLRESDSAEYKCRVTTQQPDVDWTGSPGVSFSVTGDAAFLLLNSFWRLILTDKMLLLLFHMSRPPGEDVLIVLEETWMCQQLFPIAFLHLVQKWTESCTENIFHLVTLLLRIQGWIQLFLYCWGPREVCISSSVWV